MFICFPVQLFSCSIVQMFPGSFLLQSSLFFCSYFQGENTNFHPHRAPHDNEVCPIVKTIFHAMAMNELRGKFQVTKFSQNCGKVHNCWFPGNHCDIGGYPNGTLANSSFVWMLKSAELNGLFLPEHWEQEFPENINGEIHDETQNSPWKFMEKIPRKLEGESVFHTVLRTEYKTKALHSLPLNEYQILS